ncbi:MAG: FAD-dependent oxidoreductase [Methanocellales archaeon]|nr:FAD-dependent oxidoreductase [Methanocellales archaeon]
MYDLIIAGAGPAGITAAVYAARKKMKTLVVTKNIGGYAASSATVENYIGYQFISGAELAKKFEEHLKSFDVEIKENTEVLCFRKLDNHFKVETDKGEYECLTAIVATGRKPRLLGVPGEVAFKNRGVTYCATCDAPLFARKDVAVIGGGNSAMDATIQLMSIANKIYLININNDLEGDEIMIEKIKKSDKVEILNNTNTKEIMGDKFVNNIKLQVNKSVERMLDVQGVFIEIGSMPVKGPGCDVNTNKKDEIIVNKRCETDVPGLFAAGDVTDVPEKQIIVAAGQGAIASLSAFKYISKNIFDS